VSDEIKINGDATPDASRASRPGLVMLREQGIVEIRLLDRDVESRAGYRSPPLELLEGYAYAFGVKPSQRRLDALLTHEARDIAQFDAGVQEKLPVRATCIGVHPKLEDVQERLVPYGELSLEHARHVLGVQWMSQVAIEAAEVPRE
jgi:hypothetical protein